MEKTPITPQLLREKGFVEQMMFGHIVYAKGKIGVVYNFAWFPCSLDSAIPLTNLKPVSTFEELIQVAKEGGITI